MICDWFNKWSLYCPEKTALTEVDSTTSFTYKQLNNGTNWLCHYFKDTHNLTKGDRILVLADFHAEYVSLLGVAQKVGIIIVPINFRLSASEISFLVKNSDPSLIVVASHYKHLLSEVPCLAEHKLLEFEQLQVLLRENCDEAYDFPAEELEENHPAFILYTSGTTGKPKGAIYSHGMMLWNSLNTAIRLQINSDDVNLNVMPPFHTGGWNVLTAPILHFGGTLIMMPKFEADKVLQTLEKEKVSIFMAVPTMVRLMRESAVFEKIDFQSLRYMIVGGEALPVSLIEDWSQKEVLIRQGYGLTECGPNITSLEANDAIRKRGSIGFPNFYVQTKLVNESGIAVDKNEKGELWIKGPIVTPGYWRNPEATEKAIVDGWFKTGDILLKDEEGYLYVVDRIKNMFISGGENVYPAEVEQCILKHESVKEVCVVGVPDLKWGEVGKAIVVFKEAKTDISAIQNFCIQHLAKFKVPKYFEVMKELPKNDTGKIDRKQLSATDKVKSTHLT